jgi:hypothetical protein
MRPWSLAAIALQPATEGGSPLAPPVLGNIMYKAVSTRRLFSRSISSNEAQPILRPSPFPLLLLSYRVHEGLLDAIEEHQANEQHGQHAAGTVQQAAKADCTSAQKGIAKGLHDGCQRVGL